MIAIINSSDLAVVPPVALSPGDSPWWTVDVGDAAYGVGEISNHVLIYLGTVHWETPFPSGATWLFVYALVLFLVVSVAFLARQRRRRAAQLVSAADGASRRS